MFRFVKRALGITSKPGRERKASFRPRIEALEDRLLMAVGLAIAPLQASAAPLLAVQNPNSGGLPSGVHLPPDGSGGAHPGPALDQTTVAQMYWSQPHQGATILWLNFDGWYHYDGDLKQAMATVVASDSTSSNLPSQIAGLFTNLDQIHNSISRFESVNGIDLPNRDQDIQDILFRVSETYAPFNVQVRRIMGDGNFDRHGGNTTIFVGHDTDVHGADNETPGPFADVAGRHLVVNGYDSSSFLPYHKPNSDPFDIAFVDRHGDNEEALAYGDIHVNTALMSQAIAHEAGHTFGLTHVRTDGLADGLALGTGLVSDIMDYSSGTLNQFAANQTFNITNWDNPGNGLPYVHNPSAQPVGPAGGLITLQNSYTYLQTVLGLRPADGHAHVADLKTVDPISAAAHTNMKSLIAGDVINGTVNGPDDYQVYRLSPAAGDNTLYISVQSTGTLDPVLMVFDGNGALVQLNNNRAANDLNSVIALQVGGVTGPIFTPSILGGGIRTGGTSATPTPKQYYVVVGGANAVSAGAYVLKVANHASDPAGKIDFQLLAPTMPNSVHFQVTATVQNIGLDTYQGPGTATLYLNNQIVATQSFGYLAPNQHFAFTLDQVWHAPPPPPGGWSPSLGSTPTGTLPPGLSNADIPVYRLQIDVPGFDVTGKLLDGDPVNNTVVNLPMGLINDYFNGGTTSQFS